MMSLSQIHDKTFADQPIFALCNTSGVRVELCAFGASILRVHTPDRTGTLKNIALSFPDRAAWQTSASCAGATIGPVAGRLRDGLLHLPNRTYQLTRNDGANTLHGGLHPLSETVWRAEASGADFLAFSCRLPDGLDGFPGNRAICVRYTLDDSDRLTIDYTAETDQPTFFSLTNHTYWNLSGDFSTDAYGHRLEIAADTVSYNDTAHLPTGAHPVRGTVFDFTASRTLRQAMQSDAQHPQLVNARGYNHAYVLRPAVPFDARLTDPARGRRVTLHTDYPALVLYSGGFLPLPGCAIALEAQYPPDTCRPVLLPGQTYRRQTCFAFDTI